MRNSGEVLGDFVSLARSALGEGYKDVAAVLACAALEDALKRFATSKGLAVAGKELQEVVNALKSAGHVVGGPKDFAGRHAKNSQSCSARGVVQIVGT
jgi:hypothetical protein